MSAQVDSAAPDDLEGLRAVWREWEAATKRQSDGSAGDECVLALWRGVGQHIPALLALAERVPGLESTCSGLLDLERERREEIARLRAALTNLDDAIFRDPQVIDRAGEFRTIISDALEGRSAAQPAAERIEVKRLAAAGDLYERATAWWRANMRPASKVAGVSISGDGYIGFGWDDGDTSGFHSVHVSTLYAAPPAAAAERAPHGENGGAS